MDPILLPKLLDVLDLLASRSAAVTLGDLNVKQRVTVKRFAEIGRVLEGFRVAHRVGLSLVPDADLEQFVGYWEKPDLEGIGVFFRRYQPYTRFLNFLEVKKCIHVPNRRDMETRRKVGADLKSMEVGLTFVAVDTFKWWGMAVGHAYLSHIGDRNIYWGGEKPGPDVFEESLLRHYAQVRPLDGFANVGQLADRVCRELYIPFIRFERLFQSCIQRSGRYVTSTSLARLPTSKSPVQTILSRSRAKEIADSLRPGKPIEWTEKRFMEDGVFVGRRSVKMVKIQREVIP